MQLKPRALLQVAEHAEEVAGLRVHAVSKSVMRITATALPLFVAPSVVPVLQVQTKFF
jgi:hypothetical protein